MPFHEFDCPEHGVVMVKLPITEATGDYRPCPVLLYEVDDKLDIIPETAEPCGKKAKHIFPVLHRMLLDRRTMKKHTYPKEHGLDGPDRSKRPKIKWSKVDEE